MPSGLLIRLLWFLAQGALNNLPLIFATTAIFHVAVRTGQCDLTSFGIPAHH